MSHEETLKEAQKEWHGSKKAYVIGFSASLILTIIAFLLVYLNGLTGYPIILTLSGLALTQAIVQLLFFLHLGREAKPRWETMIFLFMVLVLLIIVLGTLWIMYDLNNRMMPGMSHMFSNQGSP
jgi:cytochrome o ubiquinol oxidase operon protein cyoD